MSRYDLYTACIGIISVFFVLAIVMGELSPGVKIFLGILGAAIFFHSVLTLYRSLKFGQSYHRTKNLKLIDRIILLNKNGGTVSTWELYGKTSVVIGKDIGENHVDIDLSKNPYAAMIDVEHAVLNYAEGNWYVEDLDSRNGVSIKKLGQKKSYKLSSTQPCKLDYGDVIFVGMCQLKVC